MINQVEQSSATQASSIDQINTSIGQSSSAVQPNSATAEESAAASEEQRMKSGYTKGGKNSCMCKCNSSKCL